MYVRMYVFKYVETLQFISLPIVGQSFDVTVLNYYLPTYLHDYQTEEYKYTYIRTSYYVNKCIILNSYVVMKIWVF